MVSVLSALFWMTSACYNKHEFCNETCNEKTMSWSQGRADSQLERTPLPGYLRPSLVSWNCRYRPERGIKKTIKRSVLFSWGWLQGMRVRASFLDISFVWTAANCRSFSTILSIMISYLSCEHSATKPEANEKHPAFFQTSPWDCQPTTSANFSLCISKTLIPLPQTLPLLFTSSLTFRLASGLVSCYTVQGHSLQLFNFCVSHVSPLSTWILSQPSVPFSSFSGKPPNLMSYRRHFIQRTAVETNIGNS